MKPNSIPTIPFFLFWFFIIACQNPQPEHSAPKELPEPISVSDSELLSKQELEFQTFKAHNGLQIPYVVLLPNGYQKGKAYPALVAFSSMLPDRRGTVKIVDHLFNHGNINDWLVIVPIAPEKSRNGWISHPAHHALEDFLDYIKKEFSIMGGAFHLFGFKEGAVPAQTYAFMSEPYFKSLTVASSYYWDHYDEREFDSFASYKLPLMMLIGAEDEKGINYGKTVKMELEKRNAKVKVVVRENDGHDLLKLNNQTLMKMIQDFIG